MNKCFIKYFIIISLISSARIFGQNNTTVDTSKSFLENNISITGSLGLYGELYSISGASRRRPGATGRVYFRPTLHLFNLIDIPFEFLLSTEGNSARQNINQFGINPTWSWGTLHLGDFNENFSDYTLRGISIRGAGISIHPGILQFTAVGGYTKRAVSGGASNGSYDRYLYGAKIGFGKESGSNFNLQFLRVRDVPSSLPVMGESITLLSPNGENVWPIGSIQNISWTSVNLSGNVNIEISRDGGNTFQILFVNQPNIGSIDWTVNGTESNNSLIKIISINDTTIFDVSDEVFTIGFNSVAQGGIASPIIQNHSAVTPQENLVIATSWRLNFLQNKISWHSEVNGSVFTRDMRSTTINLDSVNIPGIITGIYSPNISTNIDYAFQTGLDFRIQSVNTNLSYKYIGPGYTSLGLSYLLNDQQMFSASTSFRISTYGFNVRYSRSNDNLINQKIFTTSRNQLNFNVSGLLTSFWNASIMTGFNEMSNDSKNDTTRINFSSFILSTNHSFMLEKGSILNSIAFNYTYQNSGDDSPIRQSTKSTVNSGNLGLVFNLSKEFNANLSAGIVSSIFADTISNSTQIYSAGIQNMELQNKLTTSLSISTSIGDNNSSINSRLSSSYKITKEDVIAVSISANRFKSTSLNNEGFNEYYASLSVSHMF